MMTLDDKSGEDALALDEHRATVPGAQPPYEPPVLIPLGNVHALLAGGGMSMTNDSQKGQMRI
jgi:hypothetical protein